MSRAYVAIMVVTDHWERDIKRVFTDYDAAEEYCEQQIEKHFADIRDSEHTEQSDDYIWTNGVDDWGYEIQLTELVDGESR